MNLTDQQSLAIHTEGRAMMVEAGAGTGKTTVLTQRFLHLLEQHPEWSIDSIVAVTFTEKAANEMRSRIRTQIERRATEPSPQQSAWFQRRLEADRLQVSTIHSLCARILRENAIAAGIDPGFTVLDEIEALVLREEAVVATLRRLADNDHPALALLDTFSVRDLQVELGSLLRRRGTVEPLFEALTDAETLQTAWQAVQTEVWADCWADAIAQNETLEAAVRELPRYQIPKGDDKLIPSLLATQAGLEAVTRGAWIEAVARFTTINLTGGKQDAWGGKEAVTELKAAMKVVREAAKQVADAGATAEAIALDATAAAFMLQWRDLWRVLVQTYDTLKEAQAALDFTDLERITALLLKQKPVSPRLQGFIQSINHLMVDEYQDTNKVQNDIVYALAHPGTTGRLFVVGDVKQSIYRFREADVTVFNNTADLIRTANGVLLKLNQSFRSHRVLVSAVNHVFERLLIPIGRQFASYEARPGSLTTEEVPPPLTEQIPCHIDILRLITEKTGGEKLKVEEVRRIEAAEVAESLVALEAHSTLVRTRDGVRPFRFGDAVILLRSFTDISLYEEALRAADIPFITVGGRGYFNRPEVEDLVALLAALDNPADDLHLGAVLRSPLFALSDETLYRLRWFDTAGQRLKSHSHPIPFHKALINPAPTEEADAVRHAATVFTHLWALHGRVEVWELLQEAIAETGYLAILTLADQHTPGGRQRRNVEKLLEWARSRGGAILSDFVREVQTLKLNDIREGEAIPDPDAGAVQLMTIHAAKGLEFPVVVLGDLGRDPVMRSESKIMAHPAYGILCRWHNEAGENQKPASYRVGEWLDKRMEAAENKRLLYVASTRAADRLLLTGQFNGKNNWLAQLCEAWDVPARVETAGWIKDFGGFQLRVRDIEV